MSAVNEYGLTPQQERFAQEVAKGASLADAYRVAYPKSKKWVGDAAAVNASKLAVTTKVSLRINELRTAAANASAVDAEKLVREMARLAFSDPRRLMDADGKMVPLHELSDDMAAAIASVEIDEYGKVKYKLWDKGAAQEKLAKYLGLYAKDNEQAGKGIADLAKAIAIRFVDAPGQSS